MKHRRNRLGVGWHTALLVGPLVLSPRLAPAQTPPAEKTTQPDTGPLTAPQVLLRQANYWLAQNQPDRAQLAVERLLMLEPNNTEGLELLTRIQAERGDRSGAQATLAKLKALQPNDPRLPDLQQALQIGPVDPASLAEARQLAQQGRNAEAVGRYQAIFHGQVPPSSLAIEYYQTLAGAPGGWEQARDGLSRFVAANPQDTRAQLSFAELLTYRAETRADGIRRLAALANNSTVADTAEKAWHQALLWLPIDADSVPAYQAYQTRHPNDAAISALINQAQNPPINPADAAGLKRKDAFAALNANKLKEAEALFQEVLAQNPSDPDALGGLGLVRLRQGNQAEARTLLMRAMALDPEHRSRWEPALAGTEVSRDYAAARSMIQQGDLAGAEKLLRAIIARGGNVAAAQAMLGQVQMQNGDLAGAETSYRAALASQPANGDALIGLSQVLTRQGRVAEADALLDQAARSGNARLVDQVRADTLRDQASRTADPQQKLALLRAAVAANPSDPWLTLDLARALVAAGQQADAIAVMTGLTSDPHASIEALKAGAIFATEQNRPDDAAALVARLPPSARTAQMRNMQAQAQLDSDIRAAIWQAGDNRAALRERLLAMAARPDPDGSRGVAIARAFLHMGDTVDARAALATAQAATRNPSPGQRLAYAGVLLQAGMTGDAQAMLRPMDGIQGLTQDQRTALDQLRSGIAVRSSDQLAGQDRLADAYDQLAPALARTPDDPGLNMALGRLYQSAREPQKTLAINQALLQRDPTNLDARRSAVDAAIQTGEWQTAARLTDEGLQLAPNDPRAWLISADLNQARGDNGRALHDLRTAQGLRRQQLGTDQPPPAPFQSSADAIHLMATSAVTVLGPAPANPFREPESSQESPEATAAAQAGEAATPDAMSTQINQQIATLQEEMAPKVTLAPSFRTRTGSPGLDQLDEASAAIEASVSPWGIGQLRFQATPTFLTAGLLHSDTGSQRLFGTGAFGGGLAPGSQHAEGVGLDVSYSLNWLNADFGTSPLGFLKSNLIGGVELAPRLGQDVVLRVVGERRPVTDSLLSYAGTTDPRTGVSWGGVTRTRGHAQLELTAGLANFYIGGGYSALQGSNVASNQEYEAGAGGAYPIWRTPDDEVRLGLDLVYFGYQKNLDFFSLGQGGYFSPQSYFATLVPLTYQHKSGDFTWSIGGALGYQTYNEQSSPVFPNDPGLQNALEAQAAGTPGLTAVYPGQNASGVVGNAKGSFDYRISDVLRVGGQASFQHTGNWSETQATVFARYIFSGAQ